LSSDVGWQMYEGALARIAELEAALRGVVAVEPIYSTGPVDNRYCFYSCDWDEYTREVHSPDCPWLVAKGLLDE
jgi:hypothetical protein